MSRRRIHKVPLERSRHCLSPVFVSNVLRSVPHFVSFCPRLTARAVSLFSCQTFLNPLSLLPRFLHRDLKRGFQLRGHCPECRPTLARRQFHSCRTTFGLIDLQTDLSQILSASSPSELTLKSSAYEIKPITGLSVFVCSITSVRSLLSPESQRVYHFSQIVRRTKEKGKEHVSSPPSAQTICRLSHTRSQCHPASKLCSCHSS